MTTRFLIILLLFASISGNIYSQGFEKENKSGEYISWAVLQMIPSPVIFQDSNADDSRIAFGLRWHVTPINFSFSANKYVSPVQFFKINPVRRFAGSAEVFFQPELVTGGFDISGLKKFGINYGLRGILPVSEKGESIAFSLGLKHSLRKDVNGNMKDNYGVEAGFYFVGGMLGIQYTHNIKTDNRFNLGIYIKYF